MLFTIRKIGQNDFVNKNWPNDPRISCKYLSNLVELIEINVDIEELQKIERAFEKMKLWSFNFWILKKKLTSFHLFLMIFEV